MACLFICFEGLANIKKQFGFRKSIIFQQPNFFFMFSILYWSVHLKYIYGDEDEKASEMAGW